MTGLVFLIILALIGVVAYRLHQRRVVTTRIYREGTQIDRKTGAWLEVKPTDEEIKEYRQLRQLEARIRRVKKKVA